MFSNKSFHQQAKFLKNTLKDVFSKFHGNKFFTFTEKDPPRMKEYLKNKLKQRNKIFEEYHNKNNKNVAYITLQNVITKSSELVCKSKDDYHIGIAKSLTNP